MLGKVRRCLFVPCLGVLPVAPARPERRGRSLTKVGIGLLGCGVVGSGVVRALDHVPPREGLELVGVAVRDAGRRRDCLLRKGLLTTDASAVVDNPAVDIVVEAIGGVDDAAGLIGRALDQGKPVVTANKAVLGSLGPELFERAAGAGVPLRFEAAVAGAVPVIHGLSGLLRSDDMFKVSGVLNGTTTFVLSHIEDTGSTLAEALVEARRLGYAEMDATRDLDGTDAADKLAVLVQYLFAENIRTADIQRFGIDRLKPADLVGTQGRRWRLLATAVRGQCARVEPVLLPAGHPFALLSGPQSAVTVTGARAGAITLIGAGAGGEATACSIVADILSARDWLRPRPPFPVKRARNAPIQLQPDKGEVSSVAARLKRRSAGPRGAFAPAASAATA